MNALVEWSAPLERLWSQARAVWIAGGWAMIAIAAVALVLFALGASVYMRLWGKGHRSVPERTWREWIERPHLRRGPIGEMLDFVGGNSSVESLGESFSELRMTEVAPFERDLRVMKVCVGAAPLFGLLGTVTGMLATFRALAEGSGGEQTMGLIAKGISEALITTETGLVIALPGLFLQYQLARNCERYRAFLAHLETVCTQSLHRRTPEARASS
ncbi:MAG: MotA/TolQ/ExbB proton channel family protein [Planctomycetes bacterium]|nr:MotA/TolQ/ExbB proton channel family protein [Planctomycetota bacterium]